MCDWSVFDNLDSRVRKPDNGAVVLPCAESESIFLSYAQPWPMNGIFVAIRVIVATFASRGKFAV